MNADLFERDTPNYSAATFPPPRPFQDVAHQRLRDGARAGHRCQMLMSPTGSGKCLGRDTPVLMADGTVKMVQDVKVGDRLLGPDGGVRNVLSVASGREPLYRVTPRKGNAYVVNASHILSLRKTPGSDGLRLADGSLVPADADVVNVNVETLLRSNATARHCLKGWRAPAIATFPDACGERHFPPYLLGAWLGDGSTDRASITKPFGPMVEEWIAFGKRFGYEVRKVDSDGSRCPTWLITKGHGGIGWNCVQQLLREAGVARNRHIPAEYKTAPLADRLELIAGLIDSDGSLSSKGFDWISKYEQLAEDMAFVCRSVGLAAYVQRCTKGVKATGFTGTYWRVSISGDTERVPCRAKRAEPRQQKKRHLVHGISIEPIGVGDYFGFEIDGDHLFLLGDFTVTHNTYLGLRIAHEALVRGKRALFIADRRTLIDQTSQTADGYGLAAHGVLMASHWRYDPSMPFQIASAQTLARREWPKADVLIIDEAHTQLAVWTEYIKTCEARVIGLSATPFSPGLGKLFTNLVNAATMNELTESGVLVPMRVKSCVAANMDGAATSGGEWTPEAAGERGMEIVGDVVAEWLAHGENRKTIVFGSTIAHCAELCKSFNEAGVMAQLFTSETSEEERKNIVSEFRKPDTMLRVLISVEALAKGFDVPDVSCVVDCRPLRKSLSTAIQMWGRGLRSSPNTGKTDCLLLDHSGNIIRFADDYADVFFNGLSALDAGEKLDKAIRKDDKDKEPKGCPACGYKPMGKRCVACGFEIQQAAAIEAIPGHMREVVIGKQKLADNHAHLYAQVCTYVRGCGNPETAKGRAAHLFKHIVGHFPNNLSYERTHNVQITKPVLNKIREKQIAYRAMAGAA